MKREKAVYVTICTEPFFLPIWLHYYSRFFSGEDIYVITHDITDDSVTNAHKIWQFNEVNRGSLPGAEKFSGENLEDPEISARLVEDFLVSMLERYETLVTPDIDEIIFPDPDKYSGLSDYLYKNDKSVIRCTGYEAIQNPEELPLNTDKPLLSQRDSWWRDNRYDKPYIIRRPVRWVAGRHAVRGEEGEPVDPDLYLVHLHRMDQKIYNDRFLQSQNNRKPDEFWYTGDKKESIPERFKNIV